MAYTIIQLAKQFNVSKVAIQKRLTPEFKKRYVTKVANHLEVSEKGYQILAKHYQNKDTEGNARKEKSQTNTNVIDNLESSDLSLQALVDQLKIKDNQLAVKDRQIERLQTLLDQQQKLTLQSNKQIEERTEKRDNDNLSPTNNQTSNEPVSDHKKWFHFWRH